MADKAIARLTNAQFVHSAAALVGDAATQGVGALLPLQDIQDGLFQNTGFGGVPTRFRIIDTGIYFRRGINYQYKRIWDDQGANAADFEDLASPVDFFDQIFGTMPAPIQQDPKARAARSIRDYLIPAYQKYTGSASPLPARDAAVLSNHLDRIRQLELSVYGAGTGGTPAAHLPTVTRPMPPPLNYKVDGASCADPANVYKVSPADFQTAYQILADLWIAGRP